MSFAEFDHPALDSLLVHGPDEIGARSRVVIAMHGSGGGQEGIARWCHRAVADDSVTVLAPASLGGRAWWRKDKSFQMEPDDPEFRDAIDAVVSLVEFVLDRGVPPSQIVLVGFSQGACLALELATEMSDLRFGLVMAMSGGLIGIIVHDPQKRSEFAFESARFEGNPFFLSVHRSDPAVPLIFVERTRDVLAELGADVRLRVEPCAGHQLITEDREILYEAVRAALP